MQTTAQYRVFDPEPTHRALVPARHYLREGQPDRARDAYRELLRVEPFLRPAWAEYFQLLRREGRHDESLALATAARQQFGDDTFSLTLHGAALAELGRYREAVEDLRRAASLSPDEGAVWHELGYVAWRTGQPGYALFALDRAFTLWPRSSTLLLRGRILREGGHYLAAEVAFTGARESAEFPEQRVEAEEEISRTQRYAAFQERPEMLGPRRRWFGETGAAVLLGRQAGDGAVFDAFVDLAREEGWRFTVIITPDGDPAWDRLASDLAIPRRATMLEPGFGLVPLVAARHPGTATEAWHAASRAASANRMGATFVIEQPVDAPPADVAGRLVTAEGKDGAFSCTEAVRHPAGRLAGRRLR